MGDKTATTSSGYTIIIINHYLSNNLIFNLEQVFKLNS